MLYMMFSFKTSNLFKEPEPFIGLKHPKSGGASSCKMRMAEFEYSCNVTLLTSLQQLLILVSLKNSLKEQEC